MVRQGTRRCRWAAVSVARLELLPLLGETHKSYQNATCSCSLACVFVCVCDVFVLGGFNYLHSLLFAWEGEWQRVGKRYSYLICHLISNMRHEFRTPFPRHLRPILINSQLISYEFLSEFPVGWQIEEDSFVFKCKCLHFQWELKVKQPDEGIKNLQEKLQRLLKTFKLDCWIVVGVCCVNRIHCNTLYSLYSFYIFYVFPVLCCQLKCSKRNCTSFVHSFVLRVVSMRGWERDSNRACICLVNCWC